MVNLRMDIVDFYSMLYWRYGMDVEVTWIIQYSEEPNMVERGQQNSSGLLIRKPY